jgi:hypothetical protein
MSVLNRTYAIVTLPGCCVTLKTLLLRSKLLKVSQHPTKKCAGCVSPTKVPPQNDQQSNPYILFGINYV